MKQEKSKADAAERAAIEEARRELLARHEHSAASAAMIICVSIKDRLQMLKDAQTQWMENYKQSLEEWSLRNQVCLREFERVCGVCVYKIVHDYERIRVCEFVSNIIIY